MWCPFPCSPPVNGNASTLGILEMAIFTSRGMWCWIQKHHRSSRWVSLATSCGRRCCAGSSRTQSGRRVPPPPGAAALRTWGRRSSSRPAPCRSASCCPPPHPTASSGGSGSTLQNNQVSLFPLASCHTLAALPTDMSPMGLSILSAKWMEYMNILLKDMPKTAGSWQSTDKAKLSAFFTPGRTLGNAALFLGNSICYLWSSCCVCSVWNGVWAKISPLSEKPSKDFWCSSFFSLSTFAVNDIIWWKSRSTSHCEQECCSIINTTQVNTNCTPYRLDPGQCSKVSSGEKLLLILDTHVIHGTINPIKGSRHNLS